MLTLIGMIAGILTTISFLPQVIKTLKSHSTKDLSLTMYTLFTCGVAMWLIYGIGIGQLPIILSNIVTLILALLLLFAKMRYK